MSDEPKGPEPLISLSGKPSAEHIAKINVALESSKGERSSAAEILGIPRARLQQLVRQDPALTARWGADAGLSAELKINDTTTINRVPPTVLALSESQRMATQLMVTEKKMNRSLMKLGFRTEEIQAISSVEEFAGQHFGETLNIMHGGLLKSAMRLMLMAERIERTYLQDESLEERDRKYWWDTYFRILEKLRDFNEQTNKAALTKAMIELKKKESEGGRSVGKIGFQPLSAVQVNVNGAKDVQITSEPPRSN